MSKQMLWFLIFIVINTIITVVYFLYGFFKQKTKTRLITIRCIVMLCAPGVGLLLFFTSWLCYRIFFREDVDLSDVVFSKEREREIIRTNEERDRNVVPLEEAIEVAGNAALRGLVMNITQGDVEQLLSSISMALNSEDSETAHYAASVLQQTLSEFRLKVSKDYQAIQRQDEFFIERSHELINYMNRFLSQKVFSSTEQKAYVGVLENVATLIYEFGLETFTSDLYETVCLRLLEVEEYGKCNMWCDRAMNQFPEELSSYTCKLKLYFNTEQRDRFFATMEELKRSAIVIDKETLNLIRTFQ
ncbi:MAG: hypothetical protein MJ123_01405 [Lachnospiraceae bacterium]|nr:hypothetical protein [Lachnospiraceae bacterium]